MHTLLLFIGCTQVHIKVFYNVIFYLFPTNEYEYKKWPKDNILNHCELLKIVFSHGALVRTNIPETFIGDFYTFLITGG